MNAEKLDETIEVIEDAIIREIENTGLVREKEITALAKLIKARMIVELGELGLKELS